MIEIALGGPTGYRKRNPTSDDVRVLLEDLGNYGGQIADVGITASNGIFPPGTEASLDWAMKIADTLRTPDEQ